MSNLETFKSRLKYKYLKPPFDSEVRYFFPYSQFIDKHISTTRLNTLPLLLEISTKCIWKNYQHPIRKYIFRLAQNLRESILLIPRVYSVLHAAQVQNQNICQYTTTHSMSRAIEVLELFKELWDSFLLMLKGCAVSGFGDENYETTDYVSFLEEFWGKTGAGSYRFDVAHRLETMLMKLCNEDTHSLILGLEEFNYTTWTFVEKVQTKLNIDTMSDRMFIKVGAGSGLRADPIQLSSCEDEVLGTRRQGSQALVSLY